MPEILDVTDLTDADHLIEVKSLLESFVIDNDELENLEDLLAEFNIFEAIGAVRRELRHSDFLGFLLNPTESHKLGEYPLKSLLKRIVKLSNTEGISVVDIDVADFYDAEVYREWRNIDILIKSEENNLILTVENKVDSTEHSNQLNRYQSIVEEQYPSFNKLYAYLTPAGNPASNDLWVPLSYTDVHDVITRTTNAVKTTIGADVLTLLQHYCAMLRRHIMTENEIAVLCQKIYKKHRKALDLIFEHRPDEVSNIYEHLVNLIQQRDDLILDHPQKSYIRFAPQEWESLPGQKLGEGWTKSNRLIMFEFSNWADGLSLGLLIGPGDRSAMQMFFDKTDNHTSIFKGRRAALNKQWTQVYRHKILGKTDMENSELEQRFEKIDKFWEKFFSQEYQKIVEIISQ